LVGCGLATVLAIGFNVPSASAEAGIAGLALAPANNSSTAVAGYVVKAPASASGATTFKVPVLKCSSTLSGISLGAFVAGSNGFAAASVFAVCQGGKALFAGVLQVNGKPVQQTTFTPVPGDVVVVSASQSASKSTASLKDVKQGKSATLSGAGATNVAVLDGIDSLVNNTTHAQLPVPNFGTAPYSRASEDGKTLMAAGSIAVDMATATHVLQIKTSALGATGNSFSETFKHS
jgi:hypothetical protein